MLMNISVGENGSDIGRTRVYVCMEKLLSNLQKGSRQSCDREYAQSGEVLAFIINLQKYRR